MEDKEIALGVMRDRTARNGGHLRARARLCVRVGRGGGSEVLWWGEEHP